MIDITKILEPISASNPCGEDLSFSHEFDQIIEARRQDDTSLSQGEWATDLKSANWELVVELSSDLLKNKTKDIRVIIWLLEGLAKTEGYQGLTTCFELFKGCCESWWEQLHPGADDTEIKIGALDRFVNYVKELICQIPITQSTMGKFSVIDYEDALQLETQLTKNPDYRLEIPEGKITLQKFAVAQQHTPRNFYTTLQKEFTQSQIAWQKLCDVIDQKVGMDAPSFTQVFDTYGRALRVIQKLCKEVGVIIQDQAPKKAPENTTSVNMNTSNTSQSHDVVTSTVIGNGDIRSRAQAVEQLERIADFFQRTEPHSPVAYLANKAANWANMPLHQWLKSVVRDGASLAHLQELLGINEDQDNSVSST